MIGILQPTPQIHTIVSLPFAENTYLVWPTGRDECLVIDPGLEPELILEALQERGLRPAMILNTHGHADHIAGNEAMKQAFAHAPLVIGEREQALLVDPSLNLSGGFGMALVSPPADRVVREGDVVEAAGLRLEVLDIPGHSPGHVVYLLRGKPCLVFGGDVLFREGIGRTDFPGGSHPLLVHGIRQKLFSLPGDTVVYPGHGPVTTVDHERRANPFVSESAME